MVSRGNGPRLSHSRQRGGDTCRPCAPCQWPLLGRAPSGDSDKAQPCSLEASATLTPVFQHSLEDSKPRVPVDRLSDASPGGPGMPEPRGGQPTPSSPSRRAGSPAQPPPGLAAPQPRDPQAPSSLDVSFLLYTRARPALTPRVCTSTGLWVPARPDCQVCPSATWHVPTSQWTRGVGEGRPVLKVLTGRRRRRVLPWHWESPGPCSCPPGAAHCDDDRKVPTAGARQAVWLWASIL